MNIDYQDSLLRDINKDLLLTNSNLKTSTDEVIKQGGQLSNISENLQDAGTHIKATDNTMLVIEWRARCHRIVLYSTIVLEFITIIVLLLYKLLHEKYNYKKRFIITIVYKYIFINNNVIYYKSSNF